MSSNEQVQEETGFFDPSHSKNEMLTPPVAMQSNQEPLCARHFTIEDLHIYQTSRQEGHPAMQDILYPVNVSLPDLETTNGGAFNFVAKDEDSMWADEKLDPTCQLSDLCRLCASAAANRPGTQHIFDHQSNLHDIINSCLPIKVALTDALPLLVCGSCHFALQATDRLATSALRAHRHLSRWLHQEQQLPQDDATLPGAAAAPTPESSAPSGLVYTFPLEYTLPSLFEEADPPHKTETRSNISPLPRAKKIVNQAQDKKSNKNQKSSKSMRDDEENKLVMEVHKCHICDAKFSTPSRLQSHVLKRHKNANHYPCKVCKKVYNNYQALKVHFEIHGPQQYKCITCSKLFSQRKNFEAHIRVVHNKQWVWKCNFCQCEFASEKEIETHLLSVHDDHCKFPSKMFYTKISPYQCAHCGKYFACRKNIVVHLQYKHNFGLSKPRKWKSTPKYEFICEICGRSFKLKPQLKIHYNVHKAVKDFRCTFCDKSFCTKEILQDHVRLHTGEEPFKCEVCDKLFRTKRMLRTHSLHHTGVKPYQCQFCGKGFKGATQMRYHERVHTGERPVVCHFCNKGFKQHADRKRHVRTVHKDQTLLELFTF